MFGAITIFERFAWVTSCNNPRRSADKEGSRVCGFTRAPRFTIKRDKSIFALLGLMTPSRALLSHVKPDTLNRDAMESARRGIGSKDESASRISLSKSLYRGWLHCHLRRGRLSFSLSPLSLFVSLF